ncbi:uncharacterized protein LOC126378731 [Pectinophora gossypiella]|uniref:uncharacterized protein LOC126378731 n=1 Tax=Pectinophora gossypiella TaxID=13191 RepID=UPI00214EFDF2|nr:uncharacterized protein LOC126378731 [Pectinophora gossypiella]
MSSKNTKIDAAAGTAKTTTKFSVQSAGVLAPPRRRVPSTGGVSLVKSPRPIADPPSGSGTPAAIGGNLQMKANGLYLEAKSLMEQSGNIKTTIKEGVIKKMTEINNIVLSLAESRDSLQSSLERSRLSHAEALLKLEREHSETPVGPLHTATATTNLAEHSRLMEELMRRLEQHERAVQECGERTESLKKRLGEANTTLRVSTQMVAKESNLDEDKTSLMKSLNEQRELLVESNSQITTLHTKIDKLTVTASATSEIAPKKIDARATYASIAAKPITPVFSVIVSSETEQDTSNDVITKIRSAVDAKASGLKVDRIRKARDQKVIVSCGNRDEVNKVSDKIRATASRLRVEPMLNKDPLVILKDVLTVNTDEDIKTALKNQNKHLFEELPVDHYRAEVKYRRRARNQYVNHVVLQVSPQVWQKLVQAGRAHIDLQRVVVTDQSPLVQCSRCLGYGHGRKYCKETQDLCSHCAEPHLKVDCPSWTVGDPPTCKNCVHSKADRTDHNAFDVNCPIRKKWDEIARSSVAYC